MLKKINEKELERITGGSGWRFVGHGWRNMANGWAGGVAAKRRFPGSFLNGAFYVTNNN